MRKRAKSRATIDKADKALQNYFRTRFPSEICEVCGKKAEVRHHHIEKSKSNFLRFHGDNLIALCHFCHSKIIFGDHQIVAIYSIGRGRAWLDKISELRKVKKQYYTKKELEKLIEAYGTD